MFRSNLSKLLSCKEVGRAFTILSLFQGILPFVTRPFYAALYKLSLQTFPAAFRLLTAGLYFIVLAIIVAAHFGLLQIEKKQENKEKMFGECCTSDDRKCELIRK